MPAYTLAHFFLPEPEPFHSNSLPLFFSLLLFLLSPSPLVLLFDFGGNKLNPLMFYQ